MNGVPIFDKMEDHSDILPSELVKYCLQYNHKASDASGKSILMGGLFVLD